MGIFDIFRKHEQLVKQEDKISVERTKAVTPDYVNNSAFTNAPLYNSTALEIKKAITTDASIRQIGARFREVALQNGFKIESGDPAIDKYIKQRIREIETASSRKMNMIIRRAMGDLIYYGNFFINTRRTENNSTGRPYEYNGKKVNPITSMFCIDPVSIIVSTDKHGTITEYRQDVRYHNESMMFFYNYEEDIVTTPSVKGKNFPKFLPIEMMHGKYDESDSVFGRSFFLESLEDLMVLRMIESVMSHLLETNQFYVPVIYVGTKESPGTPERLARVRAEIENASDDGFLILPGNCEIDYKEVANLSDLKGYAEYFRNRYYGSLGVSPIVMGEPGAANRATAIETSQGVYDKARDFQKVFAETFETHFLDHILMDMGISPEEVSEDERPKLIFPDPDIESMVKFENQVVFLYEHNAINEDEMREMLKMRPLTEDQRKKMHFELITMRQLKESAKLAQKSTQETDNRTNPQNQHTGSGNSGQS